MPEGATDVVVPDSAEDVFGKGTDPKEEVVPSDAPKGDDETDVKELTGSETDEQIAAHFAALEGKPMTKARVEQLTRLSQQAREGKAARERVEGLDGEVKELRTAADDVARILDKAESEVDHAGKLKELGPAEYLRWVAGDEEEEEAGEAAPAGLDPNDPRDKMLMDLMAERKARDEADKQAKLSAENSAAADAFNAELNQAIEGLSLGDELRDEFVARVATSLFVEKLGSTKDETLKIGPFVTQAHGMFVKLGAGKPQGTDQAGKDEVEVIPRERSVPLDETEDDEDDEAVNSLVRELNAKSK